MCKNEQSVGLQCIPRDALEVERHVFAQFQNGESDGVIIGFKWIEYS